VVDWGREAGIKQGISGFFRNLWKKKGGEKGANQGSKTFVNPS